MVVLGSGAGTFVLGLVFEVDLLALALAPAPPSPAMSLDPPLPPLDAPRVGREKMLDCSSLPKMLGRWVLSRDLTSPATDAK